jgi:hypothetical protein
MVNAFLASFLAEVPVDGERGRIKGHRISGFGFERPAPLTGSTEPAGQTRARCAPMLGVYGKLPQGAVLRKQLIIEIMKWKQPIAKER